MNGNMGKLRLKPNLQDHSKGMGMALNELLATIDKAANHRPIGRIGAYDADVIRGGCRGLFRVHARPELRLVAAYHAMVGICPPRRMRLS